MEGVSGQAKDGGQFILDVRWKDLCKSETGELLQKGLNVPDPGNCQLCAYNEVHKT